jgi:HSP20 family protein
MKRMGNVLKYVSNSTDGRFNEVIYLRAFLNYRIMLEFQKIVVIFSSKGNSKGKGESEMAIIRWRTEPNPFRELDRFRGEVDRLFNEFSVGREPFFSRAYPAVNVGEDRNNFYIRAELPGVKPGELDIQCVEGSLVIRGERTIAPENEGISYHRREREGGTFRRIISVPQKVDAAKVSADLKNGVLTVTLPKAGEAKPRKISVKTT